MILLFTDFGTGDPYVGQIHREIYRHDPSLRVIDLFHSAPNFDPRAAAYLLPGYCQPESGFVYCCIVDPGVGGTRAPLLISIGHCHYLGPDNGLFEILCRRFDVTVNRIDWQPVTLSNSFHGRDLFAPVAAMIEKNLPVATSPITPKRMPQWPEELDEIVYIDHYGNAITGRRAETISVDSELQLGRQRIRNAATFSEVAAGEVFWYENSNGLIEIAVNQGRAAEIDGVRPGAPFTVKSLREIAE